MRSLHSLRAAVERALLRSVYTRKRGHAVMYYDGQIETFRIGLRSGQSITGEFDAYSQMTPVIDRSRRSFGQSIVSTSAVSLAIDDATVGMLRK